MFQSSRYPPHLLHKITEPQWFPRPEKDQESSLDLLERHEEARLGIVRAAVLVEPTEPIGVAGLADKFKAEYLLNLREKSKAVRDIDLTPTAAAATVGSCTSAAARKVSFWDKYESDVSTLLSNRDRESDDMMMDGDVGDEPDKSNMKADEETEVMTMHAMPGRLSTGSSMSINSSPSSASLSDGRSQTLTSPWTPGTMFAAGTRNTTDVAQMFANCSR